MSNSLTKIAIGTAVGTAFVGAAILTPTPQEKWGNELGLSVPYPVVKPINRVFDTTGDISPEELVTLAEKATVKDVYVVVVEYTAPLSNTQYEKAIEKAWGVDVVLIETLHERKDGVKKWATTAEEKVNRKATQ